MMQFFIVLSLGGQIMEALSIQKIEKIKKDYEYSKQTETLCLRRLERNQIPSICYQIKRKDALYHSYLDEKCLNTPLQSMTLNQISKALKAPNVSTKCLNFIKKSKKILKYQNQNFIPKETIKKTSFEILD